VSSSESTTGVRHPLDAIEAGIDPRPVEARTAVDAVAGEVLPVKLRSSPSATEVATAGTQAAIRAGSRAIVWAPSRSAWRYA
jgi:aspartate aminotransferase-like enzyme